MALTAKFTSQVDCSELVSQRREVLKRNGRWAITTVLECAWTDRKALITDLYTCGYPDDTEEGVDPTTARHFPYLPRAFPDPIGGLSFTTGTPEPASSLIGFTSATIRAEPTCYDTDPNNQVIEPKVARVEVLYDRYFDVEESIEWQVQYLRTHPRQFRWKNVAYNGDDRRLKPNEAPGFQYHMAVFTRNIKGLNLNWIYEIHKHVGKTNKEEYYSGQTGQTFPPETLLMLNPRIRPGVRLDGLVTKGSAAFGGGWDVTLRFQVKTGTYENSQGGTNDITHNQFWRPVIPVEGKTEHQTGDPPTPDDYGGFWDTLLVLQGEDDPIDFKPFPTIEALGKPPTQQVPTDKGIWLRPARVPVPVEST